MTTIVLDSSDRKPKNEPEGVHTEAVGGKIVTTIKKQPQDFSHNDLKDAQADLELHSS